MALSTSQLHLATTALASCASFSRTATFSSPMLVARLRVLAPLRSLWSLSNSLTDPGASFSSSASYANSFLGAMSVPWPGANTSQEVRAPQARYAGGGDSYGRGGRGGRGRRGGGARTLEQEREYHNARPQTQNPGRRGGSYQEDFEQESNGYGRNGFGGSERAASDFGRGGRGGGRNGRGAGMREEMGNGRSFGAGEKRRGPPGGSTPSANQHQRRVAKAPAQSQLIDNALSESEGEEEVIVTQPVGSATGGSGGNPAFITETRFDKFNLSPATIKALHQDLGYEKMTVVQEATLPACLDGKDVLAKAKTGTGKTLGFLVPAIERILARGGRRSPNPDIEVLVISPTRELAQQIEAEAKALLKYHPLRSEIIFGGSNINSDRRRMESQPAEILICTPGRLQDHLDNTPSVPQRLKGLKVLILDEADNLLNMGFRPAIEKILRYLPGQRQTLLFSATIPPQVHTVSKLALRPNHQFIDTVGEETEQTNIQVKQSYAVVPLADQIAATFHILRQHIREERNFKVLVFLTTARATQLYAQLFQGIGFPALEIHSRKSQAARTRTSEEFRKGTRVVLFTSDVSARGVDYPDVSMVLQVGVPSDRAQYIHRLGRTARAGKEGEGILMLAPYEKYFLKQVADLPLEQHSPIPIEADIRQEVQRGVAGLDEKTLVQAYVAWLGFYNTFLKYLGWSKADLVQQANFYATECLGLSEPPALQRRTVGMMGLKGVPGLRLE